MATSKLASKPQTQCKHCMTFRDLKSMMLTFWKLLCRVFPIHVELDPQNSISHTLVHKIAMEKYQGRVFNPKPCCSEALNCYSSKLIWPIKGTGKFGYRSKLPPCLATLNHFGFYPSLITEHSFVIRIPWAMGATSCWILEKTWP